MKQLTSRLSSIIFVLFLIAVWGDPGRAIVGEGGLWIVLFEHGQWAFKRKYAFLDCLFLVC
jgi:hypothetical protein